ncbi:MAG TPA: zf-HC2 domain-containing protein [Actinophytocola sp.]|jgi:hypothetical protein|uniref:anti-sigma factor family protein n=1 Tax=Actinophytocola sp. TaxID=1872138 RepID=UPI002E09F42A|nr:zf-HC2 domain-containing protein [Actinophytocola sp.]
MVDPGCERLREVGAELALGVLPARDRAAVMAHLQECPACESYLSELTALGDRLVGLVPGVEPPVGFEQRVMDRLGLTASAPRRHRRRVVITFAAALLALTLGAAGWLGWHGRDLQHRDGDDLVKVPLSASGPVAGEVFAYRDSRSWLYVELSGLPNYGSVSCQVRFTDGQVFTVGTFPVTEGAGQWGGPAPVSGTDPAEVRILAPDGTIVGTARFG